MQPYLEYVIKGLVDHPDEVVIDPIEEGGQTVFEVRLHPTDMGRVIGKQGATINAIRALLQVGSARKGLRARLELMEDDADEA